MTWDEIVRESIYEHGSGKVRSIEQRVDWLARRCARAEADLERLTAILRIEARRDSIVAEFCGTLLRMLEVVRNAKDNL